MPLLFVAAGILLQAGSYGFMSERFGAAHHLMFSVLAFALTTVVFLVVEWLVRRRQGGALVRDSIGLMAFVNVLTAVTFVGFFVSLAFIPASLAAAIEAAVMPLSVAVIRLVRDRTVVPPVCWVVGGVLLAGCLALAARLDTTGFTVFDASGLLGIGLALLSGFCTAAMAVCSHHLRRRGIRPVTVTAHRFHLTYLAAGALLLLDPASAVIDTNDLPSMAPLALTAVVLPLYLLQIGFQKADSLSAMTLMATVPGLTYLATVPFGTPFDPVAFLLICALVAVAACYLRWFAPTAKPEPVVEIPRPRRPRQVETSSR